MSNEQKIYSIRETLMIKGERVCVLLKQATWFAENPVETTVLASLAYEKSRKISRLVEKLGKILNH